ncbi:unnamed protein product [Allacma fusca]|uniref:Multivesicular body subunit 12A n=1 Tax=Allacma fusca TaxID=39272 RepID=A0A8J2K529_9HEXA|nr:unnamed protein product [Allacma fusca]
MNPEFRSLTAVCVVEDNSKCPLGYTPISKTHDQEVEADLWKDGFFGRRVTRYVCISKSQGRPEHVIAAVQIINDRELPPEGFSIIQSTVDTTQKPFQKKQLCFKLAHFRTNAESIIDIMILSKFKVPPGYDHIGEINGMHFCVRKISAITRLSSPSLSYGIMPGAGSALYPQIQHSMNDLQLNTNGNANGNPGVFGTERIINSAPSSPAVYPGQPHPTYNSTTISSLSGLEGVPLNLREDLVPRNGELPFGRRQVFPSFPIKTEADLEREFSYDFRTEREVLIEIS